MEDFITDWFAREYLDTALNAPWREVLTLRRNIGQNIQDRYNTVQYLNAQGLHADYIDALKDAMRWVWVDRAVQNIMLLRFGRDDI
jgi:hypothetical protein